EALFVPAAFRGQVAPAMMLAVPTFAAYALVQYALNPWFQIRRRTGPVIGAALFALAVNVGLFALPARLDASGVALVQLAGFTAGLLATGALALILGASLPWRDLVLSVLAAGLMGGILWPWRDALPPVPGLVCQALAGAALYGAAALAFDIAGARSLAAALARRIRPGRLP
ncbi:MAG: teichoic acid transporter, partial [Enterovirga sp.]|nr:teichoic acid transporter [Enterovirga sp.]